MKNVKFWIAAFLVGFLMMFILVEFFKYDDGIQYWDAPQQDPIDLEDPGTDPAPIVAHQAMITTHLTNSLAHTWTRTRPSLKENQNPGPDPRPSRPKQTPGPLTRTKTHPQSK